MKFEESYKLIKKIYMEKDFSNVNTDFTGSLTITGKDGGDVFLAYIKGKKLIEPAKHDKANIHVTISDETFDAVVNKKIDPFKAFTSGKIKAKGNIFLAMSIYRKLKKKWSYTGLYDKNPYMSNDNRIILF